MALLWTTVHCTIKKRENEAVIDRYPVISRDYAAKTANVRFFRCNGAGAYANIVKYLYGRGREVYLNGT